MFHKDEVATVLTIRDDVLVDPYLYACEKHASQLYGDVPYIKHVEEVFTLLVLHFSLTGTDPFHEEALHPVLIAALLHDVVEDCFDDRDEGLAEVKRLFGEKASIYVDYLSDMDAETRMLRKQLFLARMTGIVSVTDDRYFALAVKMADRIANMKAGLREGRKDKLEMYLREHGSFAFLSTSVRYAPLMSVLYKTYSEVVFEAKEFCDVT